MRTPAPASAPIAPIAPNLGRSLPFLSVAMVAMQALAGDPPSTPPPTRGEAASPPVEAPQARPPGILPLPTYEADFWDRSFLAGDLYGVRSDLARKGIQFELDWTQVLQSVVDGGHDTGTEYGGNLDYLLNLDLDRMQLVPGGIVKIRAQTRYGRSVNAMAGPILPVNLQGAIPVSPDDVPIAVTDLTYYQFFSPEFLLFAGKFDTFNGDPNAFASGRGATQFMNMNFVFNGVMCLMPYSTLGGGASWTPTHNVSLSTSLFATTDSSTTSGFSDLDEGWSWSTEADLQYQLGKLPGGTNLGFIYSWDGNFADLGGRFSFQPGQGLVIPTSSDSWSLYWSGWQYLYTEDEVTAPLNLHAGPPEVQGIGFFWRAGLADPDTVPIDWSVSGGIGGMGIIPGRDRDTFGVGYYYSDLEPERLTNSLGFAGHSDGMEAFYNIAITPAAHLTFDAQVVSSPAPRTDAGVVLGMRLGIVF